MSVFPSQFAGLVTMNRSEEVSLVTSVFVVSGNDFDPAEFSTIVGIEPTNIWTRDPQLNCREDIPAIEWRYEKAKQPHDSLDCAIREVLRPFLPHSNEIVRFLLSRKCSACVVCRIHDDGTWIVLTIEPETLSSLSSLHCALSFGANGFTSIACDS